MECKNDRVFDMSGVDVKSAEDAWTALVKADEEKDLDDIKMVSPALFAHVRQKLKGRVIRLSKSISRRCPIPLGTSSSAAFVLISSIPTSSLKK